MQSHTRDAGCHCPVGGLAAGALPFPAYGGGPFERLGSRPPTSVPLLIGFALVCSAEVAVGVMLLLDVPHAAAVSCLLLPFDLVSWIGFALPFGPPLGIARTILLLRA